jgi:hypothetical protein
VGEGQNQGWRKGGGWCILCTHVFFPLLWKQSKALPCAAQALVLLPQHFSQQGWEQGRQSRSCRRTATVTQHINADVNVVAWCASCSLWRAIGGHNAPTEAAREVCPMNSSAALHASWNGCKHWWKLQCSWPIQTNSGGTSATLPQVTSKPGCAALMTVPGTWFWCCKVRQVARLSWSRSTCTLSLVVSHLQKHFTPDQGV